MDQQQLTPDEAEIANGILTLFIQENPEHKKAFFLDDDGILNTDCDQARKDFFIWSAVKGLNSFETALNQNIQIQRRN